MLNGLSHVSLVVPDLAAAAQRLKSVYGLSIGPIEVNVTQGVHLAYVQLSNAKIELMQPTHAESAAGKFLQKNPRGGIHHISFSVDSVDAVSRELAAEAVTLIGDGTPQYNVHNERIAFIHPKDFLGALVELEEI
ncbi:MAG: VOC family protein [Betaproteobacteria bacterium]|jgi:methylmalonyl-CoA/ethylmalonyl-CoA epimerase